MLTRWHLLTLPFHHVLYSCFACLYHIDKIRLIYCLFLSSLSITNMLKGYFSHERYPRNRNWIQTSIDTSTCTFQRYEKRNRCLEKKREKRITFMFVCCVDLTAVDHRMLAWSVWANEWNSEQREKKKKWFVETAAAAATAEAHKKALAHNTEPIQNDLSAFVLNLRWDNDALFTVP